MKNLSIMAVMAVSIIIVIAGCVGNGTARDEDTTEANGRTVGEETQGEAESTPAELVDDDEDEPGAANVIIERPEYIIVGGVEIPTDTRAVTGARYDGIHITQQEFEYFRYLERLEVFALGVGINRAGSVSDRHGDIEIGIYDLSPLANLHNLRHFGLRGGSVSDLSPLANLTNLTTLFLEDARVSDISPLAGLSNLEVLMIRGSRDEAADLRAPLFYGGEISDITPLAGLTNLRHLDLSGNRIEDVSPLVSLTNLEFVWLNENNIMNVESLEHASFPSIRIFHMRNNAFCSCGYALRSDIRDFNISTLSGSTCEFVLENNAGSTWMLADMAQEPIFGVVGFSINTEPEREVPDGMSAFHGNVYTLDGVDIIANPADVRFRISTSFCVLEHGGIIDIFPDRYDDTLWRRDIRFIGNLDFEILDNDRLEIVNRGERVEFVRQ